MVELTNTQIEKDNALAKKMGRVPLLRQAGENDKDYAIRLRASPKIVPTLTDEQIKLARDMHAVHSAMARGYVLPPLPVTNEQRASDEVWAQERGVQPVLREPGETDEEYLARLDASPPIAKEAEQRDYAIEPLFAPVAHGTDNDARTS